VGHIRDFAGCADAERAIATDDHEIDNQAPLRDPAPGDAGLFQFDQSGPGVIVSTIRASDFDGTNDVSNYRLDCLFGVKTLDERLATRLSGSP
jgi:hypothetical protein